MFFAIFNHLCLCIFSPKAPCLCKRFYTPDRKQTKGGVLCRITPPFIKQRPHISARRRTFAGMPNRPCAHPLTLTTTTLISSFLPFSAPRAALAMRSESSCAEPPRDSSRESHSSSAAQPSVIITIMSPAPTLNCCAGRLSRPPMPAGAEESAARTSLSALLM